MQDGPQGFRTIEGAHVDQVTSWPCALALAATWDQQLAAEWGHALAAEFKGKGANVILGPEVDVLRVQRSGRVGESISGEDPIIGARMGVSLVKALQHDHVIGTAKHFIANNQESNRESYNAVVDTRTLFEIYYRPVRALVHYAKVGSVMCSYNKVNGAHACHSSSILNQHLKRVMRFDGFVMSDWWSTHGPDAAKSGLDMEQPGNGVFGGPHFTQSALQSKIDSKKLDSMVLRILTSMIRVGVMNTTSCAPPHCQNQYLKAKATNRQHQNLARRIAGESIVLLKNDHNTLPIDPTKPLKLAIVGSACNARNPTSGLSWNDGSYYVIGGSGRVLSTRTKSFLKAMQNRAREDGNNFQLVVDSSDSAHSALNAMRDADVAFLCLAKTSTESADRSSLNFDKSQFADSVVKDATIPVVGVFLSPGPMQANFQMDAMINLFLGGEATGDALTDVVFGDVNPSGRLPVTYPKSQAGTIKPCSSQRCEYTEKLKTGYRGMTDSQVRYPFGHGLSYSTFAYALGEECEPTDLEVACFFVSLTNEGPYDGAEVVQLYVEHPAEYHEPPKILKDFQKIYIPVGETLSVRLALTKFDMEIWDQKWVLPSGEFQAFIGPSLQVVKFQQTFVIESAEEPAEEPEEEPEEEPTEEE
eukprot:CAMPEP_0201479586 /NCGR_PEP_ID=MMETSP0151_2-20130828/4266_1 /ASSEMBLY_ACC=CAM_ASM_000257 /TAXON_ID=200890 /ORGANISM="Paramoeba atlantica, Strain 621/1 / CCAP 1560/9" /LENGTH=643 /DNA_ID=CAMNT_0047861155 /DNA_START=228 /DNA_END=2159 /DNA_ORIENTATION=-